MADFPDISKPTDLKQSLVKRRLISPMENGKQQSRAAETGPRYKWTWSHIALSAADLASLNAFFIANQGGTFTWDHPSTGTEYTVMFDCNEIVQDLIGKLPGYHKVAFKLVQE